MVHSMIPILGRQITRIAHQANPTRVEAAGGQGVRQEARKDLLRAPQFPLKEIREWPKLMGNRCLLKGKETHACEGSFEPSTRSRIGNGRLDSRSALGLVLSAIQLWTKDSSPFASLHTWLKTEFLNRRASAAVLGS